MVFLLFLLFVFICSCFQAENRLLITKAAAALKNMICDINSKSNTTGTSHLKDIMFGTTKLAPKFESWIHSI